MQRNLWLAACLVLLSLGCGSRSEQKLHGTGSTFVSPLMTRWASEYQQVRGVPVNYESVSSGTGIQRLNGLRFDFICTDAPLNKEQLEKARRSGGEVLHIPLVLGAVVAAYNLDQVAEPLTFSGPVLADIFLGKITRWNDKALKDLNPTATLPDKEIKVVHRVDASGTTWIWTDYLAKANTEWQSKVGVDTAVTWPVGVGRQGNPGVAAEIKNTPGSLGYVELGQALESDLRVGLVKNKAGVAVKPSLEAVAAAIQGSLADIPENLQYSLTNAPGKDAYPISGTAWAVLFVKQPAGKKQELLAFLRWATHEGQKFAEELHYTALPTSLVEQVEKKLDQVTVEK